MDILPKGSSDSLFNLKYRRLDYWIVPCAPRGIITGSFRLSSGSESVDISQKMNSNWLLDGLSPPNADPHNPTCSIVCKLKIDSGMNVSATLRIMPRVRICRRWEHGRGSHHNTRWLQQLIFCNNVSFLGSQRDHCVPDVNECWVQESKWQTPLLVNV